MSVVGPMRFLPFPQERSVLQPNPLEVQGKPGPYKILQFLKGVENLFGLPETPLSRQVPWTP